MIPKHLQDKRNKFCLEPDICRSDFMDRLPCGACEAFEAGVKARENEMKMLANGVNLLEIKWKEDAKELVNSANHKN